MKNFCGNKIAEILREVEYGKVKVKNGQQKKNNKKEREDALRRRHILLHPHLPLIHITHSSSSNSS